MSLQQRIVDRGNWQYLMCGQTSTHKRRKGTEVWEVMDSAPAAEDVYRICLVRHNQAGGGPLHWSLFIYKEGINNGMVIQVKGDVLHMRHWHAQDIDIFGSDSFRDQFDIGIVTETQRNQIWTVAHQLAPPKADSQGQVVENCQGWTIRFVQWLVQQGIVNPTWIESLRNMMQPVS